MEAALARWLTAELGDPGPFREQVLTGGNSNETLLVRSECSSWIRAARRGRRSTRARTAWSASTVC